MHSAQQAIDQFHEATMLHFIEEEKIECQYKEKSNIIKSGTSCRLISCVCSSTKYSNIRTADSGYLCMIIFGIFTHAIKKILSQLANRE